MWVGLERRVKERIVQMWIAGIHCRPEDRRRVVALGDDGGLVRAGIRQRAHEHIAADARERIQVTESRHELSLSRNRRALVFSSTRRTFCYAHGRLGFTSAVT